MALLTLPPSSAALERDLSLAKEQAAARARERDALRMRLDTIETSTVWRASRRLRDIGHRNPERARILRRIAKALYWTATGQLFHRLRLRRNLGDLAPPAALVTPAALQIPSAEHPAVSILIQASGSIDSLLRCLASIASHHHHTAIEVLLIDPGRVVTEHLRGHVTGFQAVDTAAQARGEFLLLLHPDSEVMPGAIDALADRLAFCPDVGMVGPRVRLPDGQLLQAGLILWRNGRVSHWGEGEDPDRPEFNYRREVDLLSRNALIVRRSLFDALHGFDSEYPTAEEADADFALRLRALGATAMIEPRAVVVYHGPVGATDDNTDPGLLRDRWAETLACDHVPAGTSLLRARDRARHRTVILVVDHAVPEPDHDAGSRAIFDVLTCLVDAGWVVKFWPQNPHHSKDYAPHLEEMGIEVLDGRGTHDIEVWLKENGDTLHHVLVSRPTVAFALAMPIISNTTAPVTYYGHDLHFARLRREAEVTQNDAIRRLAEITEAYERKLWRLFDTVIYLSEEEAHTVRTMAPTVDVHSIVPYCFDDFPERAAPVRSSTILFVAGFSHAPNVDAAIFLVQNILPLVRAKRPEARLALVGSHPTPAVMALAGPDVDVTGWVSDADLGRHYRDSRVAVVPLRFGAGVKGKVVQALREGLPLVTTPIGAQGIPGLDRLVPIWEQPQAIADALLRLLADDDAWMAQSRAQVRFAAATYSRAAMRMSLLAALPPRPEAG
jgi:glycosyltransferase involved in cell wall biosynthesis